MESSLYTKIFLVALFFKSLIESLLDKRNLDHIYKNRHSVPEKFRDQISIEDHQKAADYSIAKIKASQVFHLIDLVVFITLTLLGGIELIAQWAIAWSSHSIIQGLIFFGLLGTISSIISLPQSLYFTFVIEERFGFNKTTYKTFILDLLKGTVLALLIGAPIAYVILWVMSIMGVNWWIYAFLFLTLIQFSLIYLYPKFIAPLFNKFTPLEEGEIKSKIEALLQRCGFQASGLFVMDASKRSGHGNAYFTGFGKNKRIVFFDTLLKSLTPLEVEAVLAHELGHMKKKHIQKALIKSLITSFLGFALLGYLKNNVFFFNGHGVQTLTDYTVLALFSMVIGTYTFFLTPLNAYFSRKHEYEADFFAYEHSSAEALISSLVKMYKDNASTLTPDPLYSKFYFSHPPASERVSYLESLVKLKKT